MTPDQAAEFAFRLAVAAHEVSSEMDVQPSDFRINVDVLVLDPAQCIDITVIPVKKEVIDGQQDPT